MKRPKSFSFLLELLISIVMFTICSIVFVNLFSLASYKNKQANLRYKASLTVQTIAEEYRLHGTSSTKTEYDTYSITVSEEGNTYTITAIDSDGEELETIHVYYLGGMYE